MPVINWALEPSMETTSILNDRMVTIDDQKKRGGKNHMTVF